MDRARRATEILKRPGRAGIYDARRLPDGGIACSHRGGLAVFDSERRIVLEHAAKAGPTEPR